jgi:hypothetical protein
MSKISIKETQNPTILKFEFQDFILKMKVLNLKILMKQNISFKAIILLTVCKTVYTWKFYSNRKYSIVEWDDVKDDVAEQIEEFVKTEEP